jgi:hypothetical protein
MLADIVGTLSTMQDHAPIRTRKGRGQTFTLTAILGLDIP